LNRFLKKKIIKVNPRAKRKRNLKKAKKKMEKKMKKTMWKGRVKNRKQAQKQKERRIKMRVKSQNKLPNKYKNRSTKVINRPINKASKTTKNRQSKKFPNQQKMCKRLRNNYEIKRFSYLRLKYLAITKLIVDLLF
jgi:hypothetical protein